MWLDRDPALCVWENEGGPVTFARTRTLSAGSIPGPRGGVPRFLNDVGSRVVTIGVRALNCIGATPPADHPHVYLDMGDRAGILCPYCATRFCFDQALSFDQTRPRGCFYDDGAGAFGASARPLEPERIP